MQVSTLWQHFFTTMLSLLHIYYTCTLLLLFWNRCLPKQIFLINYLLKLPQIFRYSCVLCFCSLPRTNAPVLDCCLFLFIFILTAWSFKLDLNISPTHLGNMTETVHRGVWGSTPVLFRSAVSECRERELEATERVTRIINQRSN